MCKNCKWYHIIIFVIYHRQIYALIFYIYCYSRDMLFILFKKRTNTTAPIIYQENISPSIIAKQQNQEKKKQLPPLIKYFLLIK